MTHEELLAAVHYSPVTGIFTWRQSTRTHSAGARAGCETQTKGGRYRVIRLYKKLYLEHRLALFYMFGSMPVTDVDHINGDTLNNSIANLRAVSHAENMKNQKRDKRNKSGVTGVYWNVPLQKWRAVMKVNGRMLHLGVHSIFEDAVAARKAGEQMHGYHPNHGRTEEERKQYTP